MHRVYNFNVGTNDNGNVVSITNCRNTNRTQNFTYDSLNRIETAATQGTTCTSCWGQMFGHMSGSTFVPGIDAWGNLHEITVTQGSATTLTQAVNNNNQFVGMTYDAAGNLINDGAGNAYTYDGENQLTSVSGAGGWTYIYDGDGQRVAKCSGTPCVSISGGQLYWRNLAGESLLETDWKGNISNNEYVFFGGKRIANRAVSGGAVYYYFGDHLGSISVVASATGTVKQESDYYPFGGEVVVSGGGYTNYKFTGKERDGESGLDNFGARYHASSLGRLMTPDASPTKLAPQSNPQRWNLYSYVENSPLTSVDPTGKETEVITLGAIRGNRSSGLSGSNPFGHTAIRIKNSKGDFVYTFGPTADRHGYLWKVPTAQYLEKHFSNEPNRGITGQVLNFETGGKQENATQGWLENYLKQQAVAEKQGNLPQYSEFSNNCTELVCHALGAGGLRLDGGFVAPGGLEAQLTPGTVTRNESSTDFMHELQGMQQQDSTGNRPSPVAEDAQRQCELGNKAACDFK